MLWQQRADAQRHTAVGSGTVPHTTPRKAPATSAATSMASLPLTLPRCLERMACCCWPNDKAHGSPPHRCPGAEMPPSRNECSAPLLQTPVATPGCKDGDAFDAWYASRVSERKDELDSTHKRLTNEESYTQRVKSLRRLSAGESSSAGRTPREAEPGEAERTAAARRAFGASATPMRWDAGRALASCYTPPSHVPAAGVAGTASGTRSTCPGPGARGADEDRGDNGAEVSEGVGAGRGSSVGASAGRASAAADDDDDESSCSSRVSAESRRSRRATELSRRESEEANVAAAFGTRASARPAYASEEYF